MAAHRFGKGLKPLLAACLLLCLGACSGTTFVYNRLDTILPWYIDDYVDLSGSQERQLDATLEPFLRWHRQQELPRYVDLLNQIDASLDHTLSTEEIAQIYSGMETAWQRLEEESLDWLLEIGGTLTEEQVQEFLGYLAKRQQEYEEEYLTRSDQEYREESYESFVDSMEDNLGRLSKEQRARVEKAVAELQRSDAAWLEERAVWQARLAVFLQREPGWEDRVRAAVAGRGDTVSPRYLEIYEHNLNVIFAAVADVLNSRSEKQDRRLRGELADIREDLQTLIAQGKKAEAAKAG